MEKQFILSIELMRENIDNMNCFPYELPVIQNLKKLDFHNKVTFFVGENGSGKSTLLEALAVKFGLNPEGGSRHFNFSTSNTHTELHQNIKLTRGVIRPKDSYFLRAESFYNVASNVDQLQRESGMMYEAYGGKSLHDQSHGESFFSLFLNRFFGNGVYILDEPEAALSPDRQLAFLVRLNDLVKKNSQFIIATHSPIILSYPNAKIIEVGNNSLKEIKYSESKHYQTYKAFLNNVEYTHRELGILE